MELLGVVPSGAADIKLARGCQARVEALRQRNDLNGAVVDVQREAGGGRWICQTPGGETISVNENKLGCHRRLVSRRAHHARHRQQRERRRRSRRIRFVGSLRRWV